MRSLISFCSGMNFHGRPGATLESKRTVERAAEHLARRVRATCGVPAKPVARQNQL